MTKTEITEKETVPVSKIVVGIIASIMASGILYLVIMFGEMRTDIEVIKNDIKYQVANKKKVEQLESDVNALKLRLVELKFEYQEQRRKY